jgi:hypothetical protein
LVDDLKLITYHFQGRIIRFGGFVFVFIVLCGFAWLFYHKSWTERKEFFKGCIEWVAQDAFSTFFQWNADAVLITCGGVYTFETLYRSPLCQLNIRAWRQWIDQRIAQTNETPNLENDRIKKSIVE